MICRVAYFVIPEHGGLFRFYLNLRRAVLPHGIEVFALASGQSAAARWDRAFADDGCHLVAPEARRSIDAARAVAEWLERNRIDLLMPMDDAVAASCVPHLPATVRLFTRVSSATPFAYRICAIHAERLARVITMTPRQRDGMLAQGVPASLISLIPHGVDTESLRPRARAASAATDRPIRLVYAGRLDHQTKGVLLLPRIAGLLRRQGVSFAMDIIGDGPDRERLQRLVREERVEAEVATVGAMAPADLARRLPEYDLLLLPSYVEGFPNILVEAMAAGVVPIASRLTGVTDAIVVDGRTGRLCAVDDAQAFADAVRTLAGESSALAQMAVATRKAAMERFSLARMGEDYARVFGEVLASPPPAVTPLRWSAFRLHPAFRSAVPAWVPRPVVAAVKRLVAHRSELK